jgi:hypothetical protein
MSDKAVSSGDGCDPYSDDEDCYEEGSNNKSGYEDQEGSGSGDPSNDFVPSPSAGKNKEKSVNGKQPQDDVDEEEGGEENWPPWVTAKPENKDIVVVEPKNKEAPRSGAATTAHFAKALFYYLVPVLTCFLGSLVSW